MILNHNFQLGFYGTMSLKFVIKWPLRDGTTSFLFHSHDANNALWCQQCLILGVTTSKILEYIQEQQLAFCAGLYLFLAVSPSAICILALLHAYTHYSIQHLHLYNINFNKKELHLIKQIITYPYSYLFELVHGRKLFQTRNNSRIKRLIWSQTINLNPRMACTHQA